MSEERPQYWTPREYFQSIRACEEHRNLRMVYTAAMQLANARDPALLELCPELYRFPLQGANWLYEYAPAQYRDTLLAATGSVHSDGLWSRIATLARLASGKRDYVLLGRIAYVAEFAYQIERLVPDDRRAGELHSFARNGEVIKNDEKLAVGTKTATGAELISAFLGMFDLRRRHMGLADYFDAAVGYLTGLPASFLPPHDLVYPELVRAGSAAAQNWLILRHFWTTYSEHFVRFPEKLALVNAAPNSLVRGWAERLRLTPPPVEAQAPEFEVMTRDELPGSTNEPPLPFADLSISLPPPVTNMEPLVLRRPKRRHVGFFGRIWNAVLGLFSRRRRR